ncbi:MAG: alpha/beta hydrolase [Candidatus Symbiothrix sp.]|jgi:acetyl esterase/lipase|nr:alpha/beta hydrolase [Candidatus Symbiothrix sp.]
MKNKFLVLLLLSLFPNIIVSGQKIINRYGLDLVRAGERYKLKDESKIRELNVFNPDSVPEDMLIPYTYKRLFIRESDYHDCVTKTFVFKDYPDYELKLQVDLPKESQGKRPFIVWIHGGGWHQGDYNGHSLQSRYLASNGIAGVRISYSLLSQGAKLEDTWQDIQDALAFVKSRAGELGLDTLRFGFAGHSAGGHLAAYAAMRIKGAKLLVAFNGIYDLEHTVPGFVPSQRHDDYFGLSSVEKRCDASPVHFVHSGAPYTVLTYSSGDFLVDKQQIIAFEKALKQYDVKYEILEKDFYSHTAFVGTDLYEAMLLKLLVLARKYL